MTRRPVPVLGFIGGVGSGKSTLANWLARHLRVQIIDADIAGHAALAREDVKQKIREQFGNGVFDQEGGVRRDRLAQRVFGAQPAQVAARRQLEGIVHPVIRGELQRQVAEVQGARDLDLIVLDAALLLEAGWHDLCTAVVYVDSPWEQRVARVSASRGWSPDDLSLREESQIPLDDKRRAADFVVDNSGLIDDAGRQLLSWFRTNFSPA